MNDTRSPDSGETPREEAFFLPNFCDVRLVFAVVVIAELFAFVLTLVSSGILENPWSDLGLISLFLQWISLTSAAVLCLCRTFLARLGTTVAALASYLLVLLVTGAVSEAAFWLMRHYQALLGVDPGQHFVFLVRNLTISTVIAALMLRYLYVQHQWRQRIETEARARIQALQARIRPHFLFNSMNTIASLVRSRPDTAEEAIHDLSDLFRASIGSSTERNTLEQEIGLARRYLNIEALRLGERLAVIWDTEGLPLDAKVPPLTLQPLLENAIYHGIEPLPEGGTIHVEGARRDGQVVISISNPVAEGYTTARDGHRIAQDNIRQRLQLALGDRAQMKTARADGSYRVILEFPEVRLK